MPTPQKRRVSKKPAPKPEEVNGATPQQEMVPVYAFAPRLGIDVYELAEIMMQMFAQLGVGLKPEHVEALPPKARRHLQVAGHVPAQPEQPT